MRTNYIKTKIKTNPRRAVWNSPPDEAAPPEPPLLSIRRPRPADTSSLHTGKSQCSPPRPSPKTPP